MVVGNKKFVSGLLQFMSMKIYRVKITADKYPTDYTVQATGWSTAISRAVKEWKRRFKGSRTAELKVHAVKGSELLKTDEQE